MLIQGANTPLVIQSTMENRVRPAMALPVLDFHIQRHRVYGLKLYDLMGGKQ